MENWRYSLPSVIIGGVSSDYLYFFLTIVCAPAEFLAFYGLFNVYLYTMAYMYSPSPRALQSKSGWLFLSDFRNFDKKYRTIKCKH